MATMSAALVASLIWILPYNRLFLVVIDNPTPNVPLRLLSFTYIGPIDVIFAALIVSTLVRLLRAKDRRAMGIAGLGSVIAVAVILISVLITPSPGGWMLLLRFAGATATVASIRMMRANEVMVAIVWTFVMSSSLQALLALGQTFLWDSGRSGRADLALSGEIWTAGLGTFSHEYVLAAYLTLGIAIVLASGILRPLERVMIFSVALSGAAVATSFGRSAALSVFALSGVYGVGWLLYRKRQYIVGTVVPTGAFAISAVLAGSAWLTRASPESSIRLTLVTQALEFARDHPLFGIGPMRYGPLIAQMNIAQIHQFIVHNVPLIVTAEYGIIAGLAFVLWLTGLGVRALSSSIASVALFIVVAPYLLLDHMHYVDPSGIAMLGVWLVMLDVLAVWSRSDPETLTLISQKPRYDFIA